jgi:hypothetical protein
MALFTLFLLILLALAVSCLFFSKAIQSIALRAVQKGLTSRSQALAALVTSKQYIVMVRAVGLLALTTFIFLLMAAIG